MIATVLASAACLGVHVWQDGISRCNDGDRYTSGKPQPYPFHRRFCGWNKHALIALTFASLLALGVAMGEWWRAALLLLLPGAWFVAHHPTCTDAVCMALAWGAALLMPAHPWFAVLLSCVAGFIHERGPVFAALYAWHPLLLIGLVCVGWWRKPARPDKDELVGIGTWGAIKAHRPYVDLLDGKLLWVAFRAVAPLACMTSMPLRAWAPLAMAFASRIIGTDACRFLFWAAPPLITRLDVPAWAIVPAVGLHLLTFKRAI